jgi:hypothetical protein
MIKVKTSLQDSYIVIDKGIKDTIMLQAYDSNSFEGTRIIYTKDQAKELVNALQELIYEGDNNEK